MEAVENNGEPGAACRDLSGMARLAGRGALGREQRFLQRLARILINPKAVSELDLLLSGPRGHRERARVKYCSK